MKEAIENLAGFDKGVTKATAMVDGLGKLSCVYFHAYVWWFVMVL